MGSKESFFTVYGKTFSSCVCYRVADLLQFHETVLGYWVRKLIGYAFSSDFTVVPMPEAEGGQSLPGLCLLGD